MQKSSICIKYKIKFQLCVNIGFEFSQAHRKERERERALNNGGLDEKAEIASAILISHFVPNEFYRILLSAE